MTWQPGQKNIHITLAGPGGDWRGDLVSKMQICSHLRGFALGSLELQGQHRLNQAEKSP